MSEISRVTSEYLEHSQKFFPKLNGLKEQTVESNLLKIMEEVGELAQVVGKGRGLNGEKIIMGAGELVKAVGSEVIDVLQSSYSCLYKLVEVYDLDIDTLLMEHYHKMLAKGYVHK